MDQGSCGSIAIDETNLYWVSSDLGTLAAAPIGGGPTIILASGQSAPWDLCVDDANVYWVNHGDGSVMAYSKAAGTIFQVATSMGTPWNVTVSGGTLYWGTVDGRLESASILPLDGGSVQTLLSTSQQIGGMTASSSTLYWLQSYTDAVYSWAIDGGDMGVLNPPGATGANFLYLEGDSLFWTSYSGVYMAQTPGGGIAAALATNQPDPVGIAADSMNAYWANFNTGQIMGVALSGLGQPASLFTGGVHPNKLVQSPTTVYWGDLGSGEIMAMPKCDGGC